MAKSLSIESGALAVPEPDASGVRAYKGIPYAAPPLGPLRWRPPEPVAPWAGLRPSNAFGPHSVQGVVWDDIDLSKAPISEDCLYLNVWTPAAPSASSRLSVMVWIHGGGFVVGSGAEPRYDGAHLAARGIIVVTVNHRLNALGFLAHPELSAESDFSASGNYGLIDLVAALKWVRCNIAAFGGDPMRGAGAKRSYTDLARAIFRERTEAALRLYPGGSPEIDAASARALGGDLAIIHPTWAWIEAQKQSGRADIFRFRFDRAPLTQQGWFGERDSRDAGAFHAGELLYVFDNLHACRWLIDDADRALAKLTSSYWINFVANGDPNGPGLPHWPSYRGAGAPVMTLDTPPRAGPEEWRERHMFLKQAADDGKSAG